MCVERPSLPSPRPPPLPDPTLRGLTRCPGPPPPVSGAQHAHRRDHCAEEDPHRSGGRGSPLDGAARDRAAQGAAAQQRRAVSGSGGTGRLAGGAPTRRNGDITPLGRGVVKRGEAPRRSASPLSHETRRTGRCCGGLSRPRPVDPPPAVLLGSSRGAMAPTPDLVGGRRPRRPLGPSSGAGSELPPPGHNAKEAPCMRPEGGSRRLCGAAIAAFLSAGAPRAARGAGERQGGAC